MKATQTEHLQSSQHDVRSTISDYWIFLIGIVLIFMSNYSNLGKSTLSDEPASYTTPIKSGSSVKLQEITHLKKQDI